MAHWLKVSIMTIITSRVFEETIKLFPGAADNFPSRRSGQSRTPRRLCTFRCRRSMINDHLRPLYQTLGMRACPTTRPCPFTSSGTLPLASFRNGTKACPAAYHFVPHRPALLKSEAYAPLPRTACRWCSVGRAAPHGLRRSFLGRSRCNGHS